ncbi:MAG TPA: M14 family metallopeptidase [Vicinamibacteria bacterium]|nr:M14 family metallopeptidase [Vicinamibacteria bacterium]
MKTLATCAGASALALLALAPAGAQDAPQGARSRALLPPELPWKGKSEALVVPAGHAWITPAEQAGFARTPRYEETVAWLKRLAAAAPELQLVSLGRSPEGRDLWMVVASRARARTPSALRATGKPTLLVQGAIHAGEMDGKDAGLMLLRDMAGPGAARRALLDGANLLFVPIFNVDGHERFSAFTRINQRGPAEAGWRTNARNLNLNRDYAKMDAPEMRAMVRALNEWQPDVYLDVHVTDGIDYQYDITFGHHSGGWSPAIGEWLDRVWSPALTADLRALGHVPGPLVWAVDDTDLGKGIIHGLAPPRFSNGYGDARHLPTVLVENHSLKPYKQRVLGTYVLMESALRLLAREGSSLRAAIEADRARRAPQVTLDWKARPEPPRPIDFAAVESKSERSPLSGGTRVTWTGRPQTLPVPVVRMDAPAVTVPRPRAYWVPAAWPEVIERLQAHGIAVERLAAPREVEVEMDRLRDVKLEAAPFEGHVQVKATPAPERRRERFAPGSVRVSTDQPLGDLAVLLLEPLSPDSFFQWGFFAEALQPTEYVEAYVMEPMAEAMLAEDPALKAEYEAAVRADAKLAADPRARLQWLYARTPFFDQRAGLYPVGRER